MDIRDEKHMHHLGWKAWRDEITCKI